MAEEQAQMIKDAGVQPELECFDTGHVSLQSNLLKKAVEQPMFQFCLGIPWGAENDGQTLDYLISRIPEDAQWSAFGIGRMQLPTVREVAKRGEIFVLVLKITCIFQKVLKQQTKH